MTTICNTHGAILDLVRHEEMHNKGCTARNARRGMHDEEYTTRNAQRGMHDEGCTTEVIFSPFAHPISPCVPCVLVKQPCYESIHSPIHTQSENTPASAPICVDDRRDGKLELGGGPDKCDPEWVQGTLLAHGEKPSIDLGSPPRPAARRIATNTIPDAVKLNLVKRNGDRTAEGGAGEGGGG